MWRVDFFGCRVFDNFKWAMINIYIQFRKCWRIRCVHIASYVCVDFQLHFVSEKNGLKKEHCNHYEMVHFAENAVGNFECIIVSRTLYTKQQRDNKIRKMKIIWTVNETIQPYNSLIRDVHTSHQNRKLSVWKEIFVIQCVILRSQCFTKTMCISFWIAICIPEWMYIFYQKLIYSWCLPQQTQACRFTRS